MNITIHRGSNEIGGTCIEVEHSGHRIILDLGIPLTKSGGGELESKNLKTPSIANGVLPDIKGLYENAQPSIDAVLLSHAHMDHYGLMDFIHHDIPVYLSKESRAILEVGNIFWTNSMKQKKTLQHAKIFTQWNTFAIGPFKITPYLVDHSAFGSSAFLIEADGKKVFYTGDFRAHGNKPKTYYKLLKDEKLKHLDALLIEGTTLGGGHKDSLLSEADVDIKMTELFKTQQDVSFVIASGSNIDRFVGLFKATKRAKKELVIDLYQYYLLNKLKELRPDSKLPPFKGDHIRIYYNKSHSKKIVDNLGEQLLYKYKNRKISKEELCENRKNLVLRLSLCEMEKLAKIIQKKESLENAVLLYSMWSGYLEKQTSFQKFSETFNIPIIKIHSSGHAYKKDLIRLIEELNPKKVIPIHTLNADIFQQEVKNITVTTDKQINL